MYRKSTVMLDPFGLGKLRAYVKYVELLHGNRGYTQFIMYDIDTGVGNDKTNEQLGAWNVYPIRL